MGKHVITLYISIKLLFFVPFKMVCPKRHCSGLRTTRKIWLEEASSGRTEISLLKWTTTAFQLVCFLLARSLAKRKLVALDHRLTIRLKTPSKRIQHFVKVITTRNKQLNSFHVPTKKPRPPIARGLSQVMSRSSDVSHRRFPGNMKETHGTEKRSSASPT